MNNAEHEGFGVYSAKTGKELKLAMQELWVTGNILPVGARLVVRHQFRSQEKKPLEAVYAFALPRDAAMRSFRIVGEGFESHSDLKPLEKAQQEYEEGIEDGHLSALAQTYKDGLVNLNVGNIRPDETVTVYVEIAAGVSCTDTGLRFRFPFTLAPGYHRRAVSLESATGEGEISLPEDLFGDLMLPTWRADAEHLHQVGFDLNISVPMEDMEIASPSHPIAVRMNAKESHARVSLSHAGDLPDRDLVLDARFSTKDPCIFTGTDASGKERFAALIPSHCFGKITEDAPKHVVFLVDRSGSMDGKPFARAKQATLACIAALRPEDQFGVVFFESSPTAFSGGCAEASQDHRDAARAFINTMDTAGGTELASGVRMAAKLLPAGGDILLLTDGQVFETESIIAKAKKSGIRVHCLGIGSASQDRFLALLARSTGGTSHFATPRERVDEAVLRLFDGLGKPVAENITCTTRGLGDAILSLEPQTMVWEGTPLMIFGSYTDTEKGVLHCEWEGGTLVMPMNSIPNKEGETLKLIQGARLITDLETEIDPDAESSRTAKRKAKRQEKQWLQLAKEYGLANPAMALVAVVKRKGDKKGKLPETRIIPVGMPRDTGFDSCFTASLGYGKSLMLDSVSAGVCCSILPLNMVCEESIAPPAFMRSRSKRKSLKKERVCSYEATDTLDILFNLVGEIQADGGLPGADEAERVSQTLAGLLALREYAIKEGYEGFKKHAERMVDFLNHQNLTALGTERSTAVCRIIKTLDAGSIPDGLWLEHLIHNGGKTDAKILWKIIMLAAQSILA